MIILSSLSQICESSSLKNLMCGIRARIYDHMIVHTHTHLYFPSWTLYWWTKITSWLWTRVWIRHMFNCPVFYNIALIMGEATLLGPWSTTRLALLGPWSTIELALLRPWSTIRLALLGPRSTPWLASSGPWSTTGLIFWDHGRQQDKCCRDQGRH